MKCRYNNKTSLFLKRGINANNDSISDLVQKVKGKCEIEIFGRKMFNVVIMFCGESVKMYKYAKSAERGESVIIGDK